MAEKIKFKGTVDRFEGERAIIILESEDVIEIPKRLLPASLREGSIIGIGIKLLSKKTEKEKRRIEKLIKKLSS